ncbi:UNVERIFIED_CONTAM: hypothetical protein FKN15_065828 [Acipenser sinensis]
MALEEWQAVIKVYGSKEDENERILIVSSVNADSQWQDADIVKRSLADLFTRPLLPPSRGNLSAQEVADAVEQALITPPEAWPSWTLGGPKVGHLGELLRLFSVLTFTLPGTPFLYYGDEIGLHEQQNNSVTELPPMRWGSYHIPGTAQHPTGSPGGVETQISVEEKMVLKGDQEAAAALSVSGRNCEREPLLGSVSALLWVPLGQEELRSQAGGPRWRALRCSLLTLFWLACLAMLGTATTIIVQTPRPVPPRLHWWQKDLFYQIEPSLFLDTNQDGIGDINGIRAGLPYLQSLRVGALILGPFFSSLGGSGSPPNLTRINQTVGSIEDFEALIAHSNSLDTNQDGIGDINGIRAGLPYLQSLRVGALILGPFFSSLGGSGSPPNLTRINQTVGSIEDFEALIAHSNSLVLAFLRSWECVHFLILLNFGHQEAALTDHWTPGLPTRGAIVVSSRLDRQGAVALDTLRLQPLEALVVKLFDTGYNRS